MGRASEQFYLSDVVTWGVVALVCGGMAMLATNLSAAFSPQFLASIHSSGRAGVGMEQLRTEMAGLTERALRLEGQNESLATRFTLQEEARNQIVRRVGALETTLPELLEAASSASVAVDHSAVTAAIGDGDASRFEAEGGSVIVRHQPLDPAADQAIPQPLQAPETLVVPDAAQFGVALGSAVTPDAAGPAWSDLSSKLGPMLLGLSPLLADEAGGDSKRILVGPIAELSQASALCARLERLSIPCMPMPFTGAPLNF